MDAKSDRLKRSDLSSLQPADFLTRGASPEGSGLYAENLFSTSFQLTTFHHAWM